MAKINIDTIKENNLLLYQYLRGSWSHGIGVEGKSDYDYGGVYFTPLNNLLGLNSNYDEQVSDEKNDETYYEIGRWFELLLKSNPAALESLFVDKEFIVGNVHPSIQHLLDNRDIFLSKDAFKPLIGYSFEQIKRARGYNKKCNIPEDFKRKNILDFCFTFNGQGSEPIENYLSERGLKQKYCGLVNIPFMKDIYGLYYDWGAHYKNEYKDDEEFVSDEKFFDSVTDNVISFGDNAFKWIKRQAVLGYSGIVSCGDNESNEVRLSSIPKGRKPICYMSYNKDGYASHCREYREWSDWKNSRNQTRYSDNKGYNFDAKNMCETVRLIHTGIELARDGVFNVRRTWDRDFLLDIKSHKLSYEQLIEYVQEKKIEFENYIKKCTLPEHIDENMVNNLLIGIRKEIYRI